MHAERPVQRERVAAGALLALRRQHVHLAEVVEGGGEGREPGRVDTVVIGDEQDGHRCLDATAPWHQSGEKPDGGKDVGPVYSPSSVRQGGSRSSGVVATGTPLRYAPAVDSLEVVLPFLEVRGVVGAIGEIRKEFFVHVSS